ncbi:ribosomal protein L1 [Meredithblackwellia eburnea MCA 4105]
MLTRSFSSTSKSLSSTLSPLNKTTIKRQQRAALLAKAAGKGTGRQEETTRSLTLDEAARVLKAHSPLSPNSAYELTITTKPSPSIQLNALRGRVFLPHSAQSLTKKPFILVFASGAQAVAAREAGADLVGGEELVKGLLEGEVRIPDKLLATPEMLPLITRNGMLARLLGPKGLMPSVKRGTVSEQMGNAVRESMGALDWKGDERGVVRLAIGRLSFEPPALSSNVHTLLASISDVALGGSGVISSQPVAKLTKRPAIQRVMLSSTQGPGIVLADV